jgi:hypothetical protein
MDAKHRSIQIFGWMLVIASYFFALLLLRGAYIGITQGFRASPRVFWLVTAYFLFLGLAAYLFIKGRRAISIAKGNSAPKPRFGWGRMLLGAILIFSTVADHFHIFPERGNRFEIKRFEYANQTQAVAGEVATIAVCIGCLMLIVWGIWKGFCQENV